MKSSAAARPLFAPAPAHVATRWSGLVLASVFALAALGTLVIAHGLEHGAISFPGCGLKNLTGLACPGCGGTRSLAALLACDPLDAFALNPAVALAWFAAVLSVPAATVDAIGAHGHGAAWLACFASSRAAVRLLMTAIAANWIYLVLVGR